MAINAHRIFKHDDTYVIQTKYIYTHHISFDTSNTIGNFDLFSTAVTVTPRATLVVITRLSRKLLCAYKYWRLTSCLAE